jgi:hypothetical protein
MRATFRAWSSARAGNCCVSRCSRVPSCDIASHRELVRRRESKAQGPTLSNLIDVASLSGPRLRFLAGSADSSLRTSPLDSSTVRRGRGPICSSRSSLLHSGLSCRRPQRDGGIRIRGPGCNAFSCTPEKPHLLRRAG